MLISIDHHNGIRFFGRLSTQVKFHVVSGLLAQGDALPSTRALSAQLGLNPMTVSKAYSLLEAEGLVRAATRQALDGKTLAGAGDTRRKIGATQTTNNTVGNHGSTIGG